MKVLHIIGFIVGLIAAINCEPTCKYSTVGTNYGCTMESSLAGTGTTIGGVLDTGKVVTDVNWVLTNDAADDALLPLVLKKFANLKVFQIPKGNIQSLVLRSFLNTCEKLEQIQISKGTMSALTDALAECPLLNDIDLSDNEIAAVPDTAFTTEVLKLNLTNNRINDWTTSTVFAATKLPKLTDLSLSGNTITTLTGFVLPSAVIKRLDLSNNALTTLPEAVTDTNLGMTALYLDRNQLTAITQSQFSKLTALTELKLGSNKIAGIHASAFSTNVNLVLLDISNNPIAGFSENLIKSLTKMKFLNLNKIGITSTNLDGIKTLLAAYPDLESIDIGSNNLGVIDGIFSGNAKLLDLKIPNMELTNFTNSYFNGLTKLQILTFDDNKIVNIPESIFDKTIDMKFLSAKSNKIVKLKASTFEKMTKIEELDFTSNEIDAIERTFFDKLTSLKVVKFAGSSNKCIQEDFNPFELNDATKTKLKKCFDNYNGASTVIISNLLLAIVVALKFV